MTRGTPLRVPEGYIVRPGSRADIPGVEALIAAFEVADYGGPYPYSRGFIAEQWSAVRFDPARHVKVVLAPDGIVAGFAHVFDEHTPEILDAVGRVHPDHRDRGIGSFLVDALEAMASRHAASLPGDESVRLQSSVSATDAGGRALLLARGHQEVRHFWHMEITLRDGSASPLPPPPGITVRGFREGEERAMFDLLDDAFSEHFGGGPPWEEWVAWALSPEHFDPTLWYVADEQGRWVGALIARTIGVGRGWIDELGVTKADRRRGIGSHLLRLAFAEFRRRGYSHVALNVDAENVTGATSLYEAAGMHVLRRWDLFETIVERAD